MFNVVLMVTFQDILLVVLGFVLLVLIIGSLDKNTSDSDKKESKKESKDYIDDMIELDLLGVFDDDMDDYFN